MTTEQNCTIVGELPPRMPRRAGRPPVWPQRLAIADNLPPDHWVRFDGGKMWEANVTRMRRNYPDYEFALRATECTSAGSRSGTLYFRKRVQ